MKKMVFVLLSLIVFLTFAGGEERSVPCVPEIVSENNVMENQNIRKILIVYFTMPESSGIDALAGASRVVENGAVLGNTQWIADRIFEKTGGTLFAIKTVQDYPVNHEALVDQGTVEKRNNERPDLKTHINNMDEYGVVFIGYPIWWADMPMPIYSFLEEYDFSGKKIIPFSSHGGSRLAGTVETLKKKMAKSEVVDNAFSVSRNSVRDSNRNIADWLGYLGY